MLGCGHRQELLLGIKGFLGGRLDIGGIWVFSVLRFGLGQQAGQVPNFLLEHNHLRLNLPEASERG